MIQGFIMITEISSLITKINTEGTYKGSIDVFPVNEKKFVTFVPIKINYIQSTTSPVERGFSCEVYVVTLVGSNKLESSLTLRSAQETYIKIKLFPIISTLGGFEVSEIMTNLDIARGTPCIVSKFNLIV